MPNHGGKPPLVVFHLSLFSVTGGGPHALARLALELTRRGYAIEVFTRPPFRASHPYVTWLKQAGVPVGVWPRLEESRLARLLSLVSGLLLTAPHCMLRGRSVPEAWRAARSMLLSCIARLERRLIRRSLDRSLARARAVGRDLLLHIWGPAGLAPLLLDWAETRTVPALYHEMGEADEAYVRTWELDSTVVSIGKASAVICCSQSVARCLRQTYGYNGPVRTIPFMIQDVPEPCAVASVQQGRVVLGTIGRLVPHKRFEELIRALARLRQEGLDIDLVIAGKGPQRSSLERLAAETDVASHVTFTGEFADLEAIMSRFDVFVLTSSSESQSMPVTESMAYGKPVVCSDSGGIRDFVEEGRTGFLVPLGDLDVLVDRLRRLVIDAELRQEMGCRGRERYLRLYTPRAVVEAVEELYEEVRHPPQHPGKRTLQQSEPMAGATVRPLHGADSANQRG